MQFSIHLLTKLILERKLEGFQIVEETEVAKGGKSFTRMVFEYSGSLYSVCYQDIYWRTQGVGILGAEGTKVHCPQVRPVEKTITVYEEF
ncbi:TPA: hypothetical protein ACN359_002090 [Vibrio parahaemolyticus]